MRKKILAVDDSLTTRFVLRKALEPYGVEVSEACDGMEALEILKNDDRFDLIVADVNMPNMNGLEFLSTLRVSSLAKGVPFIFFTTENSVAMIDEAKNLNAQGWMLKPFDRQQLADVLLRVVG